MQVEPSNSPLSADMMVEPTEPAEVTDELVLNYYYYFIVFKKIFFSINMT